MSDENKVGLQTDPNDIRNIEKLISSVDKLTGSLEHMAAANKGMSDLARMMTTMQATMTTGFRELSMASQKSDDAIVASRKKTANQLIAEEERAWQKLFFTSQAALSKMELAQDASNSKRLASAAAAAEKQLVQEIAVENRRASLLTAAIQRRDMETAVAADRLLTREIAAENKRAANLQAVIEKRAVWEAEARGKSMAAAAASADRQLTLEIAAENRRANNLKAAMAARDMMEREDRGRQYAARERALAAGVAGNTAQAQGNSANITSGLGSSLTSAYSASRPAILSSQSAIQSHSNAMNEAHALARGLAGSLGGLWLTYGSAVPLLAGAALAASLKNVLSIGMQVESQLNFVTALGRDLNSLNVDQNPFLTQRAGADMNTFLSVSDSSLTSIRQAGEAMRGLAQNGQDFTKSIALLPTVMNLATVGEMTAGQAAIALTGAISSFNLEITDAGRVADIFAKTAASSNTSVLAMTESMKQASTVASLFKVSIEDTAAMIGVLAKINVTGGAAGTSITNMLTGFYEPTQQAKKALAQLGVETSLLSGELKPVPKLLEDVRAATANLNDTAKADILGRIVTVRGLKSLSTLLTNLDDFKTKQEEAANATNFMNQVVQQLEDSADGAFKRMAVTVEKDLVGAFEVANPYVQQLGQHLTGMFKDPSIKTGLGNLTTNLVQLTTALVDNLSTLAMLTAGYVLYRSVIAPLITLYGAYSAAQATSATAALAAAAAQGVHTTAVLTSTGSSAAYVAMLEAQTVATVAATGATRALSVMLIPALTTIGVLVAAAAAAWYLLSDNTTKADEANTKISNSLSVVHDALGREIERLEKVNALWNERKGNFDSAERPSSDMLAKAQGTIKDLEAQIRAAGQRPEDVRNPGIAVNLGMGGSSVGRVSQFSQALKDADRNLLKIKADMELFDNSVLPLRALDASRKSAAGLNTELDAFIQLGKNQNSAGVYDVQNEKVRQLYLSAKSLKDLLNDPSQMIRAADSSAAAISKAANAEKARVAALKIDLKQLNEQVQSQLAGKPVKDDKKAAADALRAELERLKLNKELLAVEQQTTVLRNQAANKAGTLGNLGLLDEENRMAKAKAQAAIDAAKASIAEVQGIDNKRTATVKYQNQLAVGKAQMEQEDIRTGIAKAALFEQMSNDANRFAAKTLADQGQYTQAFLMEYEATYGPTIKRVEADLTTDISEENRKRLEGYLDYLAKMKAAGAAEATGKSLTAGFDKDLRKLQSDLADFESRASGQAGIASIFANAQASAQAYSDQIGEIAKKQAQLQDLADKNPGDSRLQDRATAELDKMRAVADQMRGMWESVGQSIGDSMTTAFGRGGTALGGLLQATIAYANKKAQIEEVQNRPGPGDLVAVMKANQVAAQASYSAQLEYYNKLAGAAKGYFKEGTVGYKAMGAVEKATQLAGLAEAARMFIVKSSYLTGLLGIQVASQTEAAAAEGAYTLSSIAMAGARAAASGVAAAVSAMVGWPFPLNMIALAATVAAVGALGVKIAGGGGGGGASMAQRQAANGTGTNPDGTLNGGGVLGDTKAKSESIAKSLEAIDKTSGLQLSHTVSMDGSLKTLVANISGLASLLVRGTNLTAPVPKDSLGAAQNLVNNSMFQLAVGGPLGATLNKLDQALGGFGGKLTGAIFGGKKSVEDVGLTVNSGSLASLMSGNVDVNQYTDIKKKGGLFSSDKYSTDTTSLGAEVNDQFTKIFRGLYDTVVAGANILGLGGDAFTEKLKGFVVNIGEISTKGMTGEEIQTALQTAFSKLGDDMAKFGVDGLQQFQKVGEGYLETLARVANDFMQVNDVLAVLGKSFNVTGMAAIVLSEDLIKAAGGLETLTENTSFFVENFLTEAEKMGPITKSVQAALAPLGASNLTTIEQFKNLVLAQDLSTAAGQQNYAMLTAIAPQFKTMADYLAELSGVVVKTSADIRNERQELQDQYDKLTMSPDQLAAKERAKVDPSNLGLYDQVVSLTTAAQNYSDMLEIQAQIYSITGNAAGAAVVLEQQHELALKGMTAETAKWTKELWAAQAAVNLTSKQDALRSAYQAQKTALESVISAAKRFQESMQDLKDSLQQGDLSTLSPEKKLGAARSRYEDLLARARAGDKDAQSQVGQAAQNFLTADRAYNASNSVYAADAEKVQKDLASLAASAGAEANLAQEQLNALTRQVGSLIKIDDTLVTGFQKVQQAILDLAAAMNLRGTGTGSGSPTSGVVTSLYNSILGRDPDAGGAKFWEDALNNGTPLKEVVSGFTNSAENRGNQIEKLYKDILGRESDSGGKEFWMNALNSGVSIDKIAADFKLSEEYLKKNSHAKGGMASGLSLVGEQGPEVVDFSRPAQVYTAQQTAGMFAPRGDSIDPRVVALLEKISRDTEAAVVQRAAMSEKDEEMMAQQTRELNKVARLQRQANTSKEKK